MHIIVGDVMHTTDLRLLLRLNVLDEANTLTFALLPALSHLMNQHATLNHGFAFNKDAPTVLSEAEESEEVPTCPPPFESDRVFFSRRSS